MTTTLEAMAKAHWDNYRNRYWPFWDHLSAVRKSEEIAAMRAAVEVIKGTYYDYHNIDALLAEETKQDQELSSSRESSQFDTPRGATTSAEQAVSTIADWIDDVRHTVWLEVMLIMAVVMVAVAALLALAIYVTGPTSCTAATRGMTHDHRWSFWGGCQVQTPREGWVPLDNLIITAPADGAMKPHDGRLRAEP